MHVYTTKQFCFWLANAIIKMTLVVSETQRLLQSLNWDNCFVFQNCWFDLKVTEEQESCVFYAFVRFRLYVFCGHLLGKGWPLGSRLWFLTVSLSLSIGILGQVWYLIVSIPDLCTLINLYKPMLYQFCMRIMQLGHVLVPYIFK